MRTWIFQGSPDKFDIDSYLKNCGAEFLWLVNQKAGEISRNDQVFIWKSAGKKGKEASGIVAEAIVTSAPEIREDDALAKSLWRGGATEGDEKRRRALLRLIRVATPREVVLRQWLVEDPILSNMHILRMANATNHVVSPAEASRLNRMWARVGRDWTRDESVAGLWAYMRTKGVPVSKVSGSAVASVSELTGRPIPGVYNKVMNFRALDPEDARAGLSGGGAVDKGVWTEFYNDVDRELNKSEIEAEFARLWLLEARSTVRPPSAESVEAAAQLFEKEDLAALLTRYAAASKVRPGRPTVLRTQTRTFERDPLAVAITRKRAKYLCEVPACAHPKFTTSEGRPYCEVHHIVPLSEGGEDTIGNMACICPAHHREAHFGSGRAVIAKALVKVREKDADRERLS